MSELTITELTKETKLLEERVLQALKEFCKNTSVFPEGVQFRKIEDITYVTTLFSSSSIKLYLEENKEILENFTFGDEDE